MTKPSGLNWPTINQQFGASCPAVLSLVDLLLTLPASSLEAERGFSHLKVVKTDLRSRMTTSLTDQLMVVLQSPTIQDFDPVPAIHLWNEGGIHSRRVSDYRARAATDDDQEVSDCDSGCSDFDAFEDGDEVVENEDNDDMNMIVDEFVADNIVAQMCMGRCLYYFKLNLMKLLCY